MILASIHEILAYYFYNSSFNSPIFKNIYNRQFSGRFFTADCGKTYSTALFFRKYFT